MQGVRRTEKETMRKKCACLYDILYYRRSQYYIGEYSDMDDKINTSLPEVFRNESDLEPEKNEEWYTPISIEEFNEEMDKLIMERLSDEKNE